MFTLRLWRTPRQTPFPAEALSINDGLDSIEKYGKVLEQIWNEALTSNDWQKLDSKYQYIFKSFRQTTQIVIHELTNLSIAAAKYLLTLQQDTSDGYNPAALANYSRAIDEFRRAFEAHERPLKHKQNELDKYYNSQHDNSVEQISSAVKSLQISTSATLAILMQLECNLYPKILNKP